MVIGSLGRPVHSLLGDQGRPPFVDSFRLETQGRFQISAKIRRTTGWLFSKDKIDLLIELIPESEAILCPWEPDGPKFDALARNPNISAEQLLSLRSRYQKVRLDPDGRLFLSNLAAHHLFFRAFDDAIIGIFKDQSATFIPMRKWWERHLGDTVIELEE